MSSTVFLSYARDDDEAFVRKLCADLQQAGFTVWYDRESLLSRGVTFHQEIKDAIRTEVNRVVYVGGPKAALSPYVREEWQFALECDHVVVTPIMRLGDYDQIPGELSLLHCEDFRDDSIYARALAKLIESLRQPNPKLGALFAVPNLPAHFLGRPDLMRRVRDALLVDLQKPRVITSADAKVGMQGMGGIGKSVLAAALVRNREVRQSYPDGIVWIACGQHLSDDGLLKRQRDLVKHLGGDEKFPSLAQGSGILRDLLAAKAILLVLDDVWRAADAKAFDLLGPRCRMLVTTRDAGILHTLNGELVPVSLFTEREALQLLADAVNVAPADFPPEVHEVVRECGCLPLALALSGGMAKKRGGDFHSVLERLRRADLDKIADRQSINEQHRSIWIAMQASVEILSDDEQKRFAELAVFDTDGTVPEAAVATLWAHTGNLDDLDTEELLINFAERSLIQLDQKTDANSKIIRQFSLHDLVHDFAVRIAGEPRSVHQKLLDAYQKKCPDGWHTGPDDGYFFQNLCHHLVEGDRKEELISLLLDLNWLETKTGHGLIYDLLKDFSTVRARIDPGHSYSGFLCMLDEALRRDVHFIARHISNYPQALFQCLWNTCWWYDCPEAAQHYESTDGHWNHLGEKLYLLLEKWRNRKEKSQPGFYWLRSNRPPAMNLGSALQMILHEHEDEVTSVSYSPDGRHIVSGSKDKTIRIWDAANGAQLAVLREHKDKVTSVCYASGGRLIVSGSDDKTIRVWDSASGIQLAVLHGHEGRVTSVSCPPNGQRIASASEDKTVRVWDLANRTQLHIFHGHKGVVTSVSYSSDGQYIASGSNDKTIRIWDANAFKQLNVLQGHESGVECVVFSPDAQCIVSGSQDQTVRLWNTNAGAELAVLKGHTFYVFGVNFSPDGKRIVSGSNDDTVRVWDIEKRAASAVLRGCQSIARSVAFSPEGDRIVSGSGDNTLRIWDLKNSAFDATLNGHKGAITSISLSPSGERVASGSYDMTVRVWNAYTGMQLAVMRGHKGVVIMVAFSPGGDRIASASWDNTVRVWDIQGNEEPITLRGHNNCVNAVAFSPDGKRIVTGSHDTTVRVWDTYTGAELAVLRGHESTVVGVGFSPSGDRIASGSAYDDTVCIWDALSGKCLQKRAWGLSQENRFISHCELTFGDTEASPFRIKNGTFEMIIEDKTAGRMIAWFSDPLNTLTSHPSDCLWAGALGNYLALLKLEGDGG